MRIEGSQVQRFGAAVSARVVRAGGVTSSALSLPTASSSVDVPVPAGSGPIWLVLHSAQDLHQPNDRADPDFLRVESLALVSP